MGVPLFALTGEVGSVQAVVPAVTNKYTVLVNDYTQGIQISKDLFDDNMHGVWAAEVEDMARKAKVTSDYLAFGIFRGAFTTTLTPDTNALISTHTLISGGTISNSVSGALNSTTLNNAIVLLRQQPDQRGVVLGNSPAMLLVPSKLYKTAVEETESALTADSGTNAVNVYSAKYGIRVYTSPYLDAVISGGSDTAWFLLAKNHAIRRLIRQGIETALTPWQYSTNRTYFYQANFRENYFASDYVGLVGSTGL